ncbi:hypothetical protein [uncultured Boseongicola sp.]|jgi:hypothetical protein|uniref:hypothetical protein n=1 Tax=uncultured Boseongicola sp. TaxID=1648499 RepID=UPI0026337097|nr:hypothetical protein [uncultured Boseongicola sp.]
MNYITASRKSFDLPSLAGVLGLDHLRASVRGMVSGYKAYQVYTRLDGMSDNQLKASGLERAELPSVAMKTITEAGKA